MYPTPLFYFILWAKGTFPWLPAPLVSPLTESIITQSVQPNRGTGRPKIVASLLEQMNASDKALTDCGAGVPKSGVLLRLMMGHHSGRSHTKLSHKSAFPFQEKCMIGSYWREVEERWVIPQQGLGSLL